MSSSGDRIRRRGARLEPSSRAALWIVAAALALWPAPGSGPRGATVEEAIQRGRAALLPRLRAWADQPPGGYPMGKIAICAAALLKAGVPTGDDAIRRAMARLEQLPLERTYCVACYLFALDAYWQARYRESLRKEAAGKGATAVGEAVSNIPRDGPVRSRMEECIRWLVRGAGGTWSYGGRGGGDHSNTQFAILGLEIGLQNDIPIPIEVFRAIAEHFVSAHSATATSGDFSITYQSPAWEGVTTGVSRKVAYRTYLGGWAYTGTGGASYTMTAAGVSSLLVARRALERAGEHSGKLAWEVDRKIESGLGWIHANWKEYPRDADRVGDCGRAYYALYSVEKVGDIGGIVRFGSIDWYVEGARWILSRQQRDGSWGNEIDTALALLFLTRATRSHLQTMGPPVLFTRTEGPEAESDLVYIDRVKGFVALGSIFDFLAETRDPKVLPIAKEGIAAIPPHRVDEVLARVLALWTEDRDQVSRFAAETSAEVDGIRSEDRADHAKALEELRQVRSLETKGVLEPAAAEGMLRGSKSPVVKRRVLELVDRLGLLDAFGAVVDAVADQDPGVRRRAHEALAVWTGRKLPEPPTGPASAAAIESAARPWRDWWSKDGASFRLGRQATAVVERLASATDPAEIDRRIAELAALGAAAAPAVLSAMRGPSYSVHLVRALEAITGASPGIRPSDWEGLVGTDGGSGGR